jgi:LacI family transcriptional regulator
VLLRPIEHYLGYVIGNTDIYFPVHDDLPLLLPAGMRKTDKDNRGRLTLRDLASHAGVSPATVSLVLRKSPLVAKTTRERVLASIETLGYVYNRGAASMRTQRTHTVGIAINELVNPYFAELTAAIEHAMNAIGYSVFLSNSAEDPARQDQFIDTMREYNADGLIICPAAGTSVESLQRLTAFDMPCVQVSRYLRGVDLDYAGSDNRGGMSLATGHLIALGHRRIAMIGGNNAISTGRARHQGYADALNTHGIAIEPGLIVPTGATREDGAAAIKTLLKSRHPPTAAVCFNDLTAFGVMLGLRQIGLEPGRDFAVVGCDDVSEAALWNPALTSVAIDTVAMGEVAARMLLERIADHKAPRREIVLGPKLAVRASSGQARASALARVDSLGA